ncbi:pyridoxamine 5'-phosphate oxidase family protein [Niveispirillum sp.]|uniref:pyridoxamine 5'-phosphate oxidase family protein n=1 Tax=Niveispirillum sp. TaxID=1917217 RepID=UPI001B3CAEB5|nr:pyridoxamine 5'-phosphate oxidase family protein [Niveispirillum sp.]MBP7334235.1 pyridoxamine 5'-phosphate oxidase family protein [Niveispirillum sp.]
MNLLTTRDHLEAVIGTPPAMVTAKTIDHLDPGAISWLAASVIMVASVAHGDDIDVLIGGDAPGWATGHQDTLILPAASLDATGCLVPGAGFGSIFLVPGLNEIMRVNGRVASSDQTGIRVTVDECYIHCGKALIRSDFWSPVSKSDEISLDAFTGECRFLALATCDSHANADLSPKGDPAGLMVRLDDGAIRFADRPGNRRIDSFRNMIEQPRVAAALIVPGLYRVIVVHGRARITDDPSEREAFTVGDKVPQLVTVVGDARIELRDSSALRRVAAWPAPPPPEGLKAGKIATGHLKLSKGLSARLAGYVMSVPGLVERELAKDYKANLY